MTVAADELRRTARLYAGGVTVVTVVAPDGAHGMTASSFAVVSLDPPLILVSLEKTSRTRSLILERGRFAVNVLRETQESIAKSFSVSGMKEFETIPHRLDADGAPLLTEALAHLSCKTTEVIEAGDHDLFIAEVIATQASEGSPLLYFDRGYRRLK
jgi:flavin reductase (DIM6/NTAB) family NADH-FMN oxidoreductase RutF